MINLKTVFCIIQFAKACTLFAPLAAMHSCLKTSPATMAKKVSFLIDIDQFGNTPLLNALIKNDIRAVYTAINNYPEEINNYNTSGHTALMYAIILGDIDLAYKLLEAGADIRAVDKLGTSVMQHAYISLYRSPNKTRSAIIDLLLAYYKDDVTQEEAYQLAHDKMATLSIKAKFIEDDNICPNTPLIKAIITNNTIGAYQAMSDNPELINYYNYDGHTALMYAIGLANYNLVHTLLCYNANVYAQNSFGISAIQYAEICAEFYPSYQALQIVNLLNA